MSTPFSPTAQANPRDGSDVTLMKILWARINIFLAMGGSINDLAGYGPAFYPNIFPNSRDGSDITLMKILTVDLGIYTTAGGAGTTAQVVATPSGISDFSGLPGGVAPTMGVYFAPKDESSLWTIAAGDTQWTEVLKNNP